MTYYNQLIIKIFDPDGKLVRRIVKLPEKGKVITETGVLNELSAIADNLEKNLPQLEYKLVQLRSQPHRAEYNFVYTGLRPDVENEVDVTEVQNEEQIKKETI